MFRCLVITCRAPQLEAKPSFSNWRPRVKGDGRDHKQLDPWITRCNRCRYALVNNLPTLAKTSFTLQRVLAQIGACAIALCLLFMRRQSSFRWPESQNCLQPMPQQGMRRRNPHHFVFSVRLS